MALRRTVKREEPCCETAREALMEHEATPVSDHLPRGPTSYFPRRDILHVLKDFPVRDIFHCPCSKCRSHNKGRGNADVRSTSFDEVELLGDYATIFGLLIFLRYPGLISLFRTQRVFLGQSPLRDDDLAFLDTFDALAPNQARIIRREILHEQYRFNVQQVVKRNVVTRIDEREILPIIEDKTAVGAGDFGEVYGLEISPEYLHDSLRSLRISRFARKIFDKRRTKTSGPKEWINQLYANELQHEHLMPALAAIEHGDYFFILYEFAESTLHKYLKAETSIFASSQELWRQVHGLAEGLAYLHGTPIEGEQWQEGRMYHCDLKPANILIVNDILKIADFGLSRRKPFTKTADSTSTESDYNKGTSPYAPPRSDSGKGHDIFSFGTILSVIASHDVGRATRVNQYRQDRLGDRTEESPYGTPHFFYDKSHATKNSVIQEHKSLIATVGHSQPSSTPSEVQLWQRTFMKEGLFGMIERMLNPSEKDRPEAVEVSRDLKTYMEAASAAVAREHSRVDRTGDAAQINDRNDSGVGDQLDVWEKTIHGSLPGNVATTENRFIATYGNTKCGLWLYPNAESKLAMTRFAYNFSQGYPELIRDRYQFDRKLASPLIGVQPEYLDNIGDHCIHLVNSGEDDHQYRFENMSDALRFQGVFTGQRVQGNVSFSLTGLNFIRKSRLPLSGSHENLIQDHAQLQIWEPQVVGDRSDGAAAAKVAILTKARLHLIEVTNDLEKNSSELKAIGSSTNFIRLARVDTYEIPTTHGIPPHVQLNRGSVKFHEVRLFLKESEDSTQFWQLLREVQRKHTAPITGSNNVARWVPAGV